MVQILIIDVFRHITTLKVASRTLLAIAAAAFVACGEPKATVVKKVPVKVFAVQQKDVPVYAELVGQTKGSQDINIRARVDGILESMHFEEGKPVTKGQLLYTIEKDQYLAKVVEAEGKLAEAQTALSKADSDLKRIRPLAKIRAVSQRDLDAAVAAYESAQGSVKAAEAALELATIELGYTKVVSPVDGIIGISKLEVGDYVGRSLNAMVLNTVSKIDPIYVRAALGETEYLRLVRNLVQQHGDLSQVRKAEENNRRPLQLILADGSTHPETGTFHALNAQVDPATGTVTIEASFPNPQKILRPGQFARLKFEEKVEKNALLVPQRALQELQGVYQVYVVDGEGKASIRRVTPSTKIDGFSTIQSGLKVGEKVIVEGMQKVQPGSLVVSKPWEGNPDQKGSSKQAMDS